MGARSDLVLALGERIVLLGKSPTVTLLGRWKDPCRRRTRSIACPPLAVPSFFPTGSSNLTPTHHPWEGPPPSDEHHLAALTPRIHLTPVSDLIDHRRRFVRHVLVVLDDLLWHPTSPRRSAIAFSRHHVGSLASCSCFHWRYVPSRLL